MTKDVVPALTPMELVQQALTSGASVDTLERLMSLQERWQANEAKRAFDKAMAEASAEIPPIYKTRPGPSLGGSGKSYKYEDLADITTVISEILPRHGLMKRWKTAQFDDGSMLVTCIISHAQGHREESSMRGKPDTSGAKNAIQAIGSAATYLQRYTLKQALGLAAAQDDDAHAAGPQNASPSTGSVTIDAVQYRELMNLIEKTGQDEGSLLNYLQAENLNTLTLPQYRVAMDGLGKKLKWIEKRAAIQAEAAMMKEVNEAEKGEHTVEWTDPEEKAI